MSALPAANGVYVSNVDDYVAPSNACINPIFSAPAPPKKKTSTTAAAAAATAEAGADGERVISIKSRRRRNRTTLVANAEDSFLSLDHGNENGNINISGDDNRTTTQVSETANDKDKSQDLSSIVQASLADCLACSGCVTTTETVLLEEQHSSQVLRDLLLSWKQKRQGNFDQSPPLFVMTISPAAWADLFRYVDLPPEHNKINDSGNGSSSNSHNNAMISNQRKFTAFLKQWLGISIVLDGNLPLQWSLQTAAEEFCHSYRLKKNTNNNVVTQLPLPQHEIWQNELWPSQALSKTHLQFRSPEDSTIRNVTLETLSQRQDQSLPLFSSSCPAVVCLVEKTTHAAVPHLATTVSPMSLAGAYLRQEQQNGDQNKHQKIYHIAVMPCHDKKLEASRKDFYHNNEYYIDICITTTDCLTLLQDALALEHQSLSLAATSEHSKTNITSLLAKKIVESPLSAVGSFLSSDSLSTELGKHGILLTVNEQQQLHQQLAPIESTSEAADANPKNQGPFVYGSGGYAEYIFRFACKDLFGLDLSSIHKLPWESVAWSEVTTNTKSTTISMSSSFVSARTAAAAQRRKKDFYQVALYRETAASSNSFTLTPPRMSPDRGESRGHHEPVLRFALAYGMQNLQRVLKPFQPQGNEDTPPSGKDCPFDYVEAMACPSGCVNGGGQLRLSSKETPADTRRRLDQTQHYFVRPAETATTARTSTTCPLDASSMHTTYHVVPPMQLSMGAAAGVAVQDLQW